MLKLIPAADPVLLDKIKTLYLEAFPSYERKPFDLMLKKCDEGFMRIFAIINTDENGSERFIGEAIFILYGRIALLDYFAIVPELRGKGFGTSAMKLLCGYFPDRVLLLEIEDPGAECDNRDQRIRRLDFYRACGLQPMNYLVCLYGVDMMILTFGEPVNFEEYHEIFVHAFSPQSATNIKFVKFLE